MMRATKQELDAPSGQIYTDEEKNLLHAFIC